MEAADSLNLKTDRSHLTIPAAIIMVLVLMLVPLPTIALDFFITINLSFSIIVLFMAMYVEKPISFSVFPSILLVVTLYRLALNLASTRLILLNGREGTLAAGNVIQSFGEFVVGGSFVVGLVVFFVIIVIQYVVVNHGAIRISEVTARFTLDAMPGKQMSIDADLAAGVIDDEEAKRRRAEVRQEAEFYGAMDGAIRFTQRDALASIIIVFINILAGIIIGVVQLGMPFSEAVRTYTVLTVGDGLVSAVPSLFISVAGALITTRCSAKRTLGEDVAAQIIFNPRPLYLGGTILVALGLVPGLPKLSFFCLGGLCFFLAKLSGRKMEQAIEAKKKAAVKKEVKPPEEQIETMLKVDTMALEIGYGLIPLVDRTQGGDLVERIKNIRKQIAQELGIVVPPIHISDNLKLQPREYSFLIKDNSIEKNDLYPAFMLAINPGMASGALDGISAREPSYQLPAVWIRPDNREQAQVMGYTVVDAGTVLSTHLMEVIRRHAHELLTRQETTKMVDRVAKDNPKVVEELIPNMLSIGDVQKVLQNLLKERVPIRDLVTILETLADFGRATRNTMELTEFVRQTLKRTICSRLVDDRGELRVFTLSPALERSVTDNMRTMNEVPVFLPDPETARAILEKFQAMFGKSPDMMRSIVLCSSNVRPFLKNFFEQYFPLLTLLSYSEIPSNVHVTSLGMVN